MVIISPNIISPTQIYKINYEKLGPGGLVGEVGLQGKLETPNFYRNVNALLLIFTKDTMRLDKSVDV